jgi:hypothetical protein
MLALMSRASAARAGAMRMRGAASRTSPFARDAPAAQPSSDAKQLSREEEQKQRLDAMAEMLREKTLREVAASSASRRPEGVTHVLDFEKPSSSVDEAIAQEFGPEYAANYDEDREEWGGPKGVSLPLVHPRSLGTCPRRMPQSKGTAAAVQVRNRRVTETGRQKGEPPTSEMTLWTLWRPAASYPISAALCRARSQMAAIVHTGTLRTAQRSAQRRERVESETVRVVT